MAVVAAVLYSTWLGAAWLNPEFDRVANFVSELAADGQPYASLYRALDIAAGSLLAIAALLVLRRHRPTLRLAAPFVLLIALGSLTVVDALAPLSCAPSIDLACRMAEQAGQVPFGHRLHTVSSSLVGTVAVAAMAWTWWLTRRRPHATRLRRIGAPLVAAHVVTLGWSLVEIGGYGVGVLGLAQGASLLTLAAWWVVLFLDSDDLLRDTAPTPAWQAPAGRDDAVAPQPP